MIPRSAQQRFLNRELEDYSWMKDISESDIDWAIDRLYPKPQFHTTPTFHQKVCFWIGVTLPTFLFLLDTGTGKTKIFLDIFRYRKSLQEAKRCLVVVKNRVAVHSWVTQCEIHAPDLRVVPVTGTQHEKWTALELNHGDIFVISYPGLTNLVSKMEPIPGKKKKKKKHLVIQKKLVDAVARMFDMMGLDESQMVKNHQSLQTRIIRRLSYQIECRYALTGTPSGRDPIDFWSQFFVIDHGDTLGPTLTLYRGTFYHEEDNYWGRTEYKFDHDFEPDLHKMIQNRSITFMKNECLDLPPQLHDIRRVRFPQAAEAYYKKVVAELTHARLNYKLMESAFIRMRQISSGFMGMRDEEGGRVEIEFPENPKLDELLIWVEELPVDAKVVIFHEFNYSGRLITKTLQKLGFDAVWLSGVVKNQTEVMDRFSNDPSCSHLVLNHKIGSTTINLQMASYAGFYESPVSAIDRKQSEDRLDRWGQQGNLQLNAAGEPIVAVNFMDFVTEGTKDELILKYNKQGKDLLKAILEGDVKITDDDARDLTRSFSA